MKKVLAFISITVLILGTAFASESLQTIRGTVLDQDANTPLIGATVTIIGSSPIVGSVTDINGTFRIDNVPVGRVSLKVSYIGYEDRVMPNLLVTSAKELIIEAKLLESVKSLGEVVVTARRNKAEVLNEMATVSARTISVDETQRYAGSFADPARMAASFAGVTSNAEGNNDIVVRGNNSKGILWRLEGIEIPNPNHFASEGMSGGPINALSSNMLGDSDFFTGAFAPEYGNALSGVFDMKLKKGNNEQREYTTTFSTLGLDFSFEGPFKEGYRGSYLANYRYSTLALIDNLGLIDFGGVPKYQDLTYNIFLPIGKQHTLSFFGLGGLSAIAGDFTEGEEVIQYSNFSTDMLTSGITHIWQLNKNSFIKNTVSYSGTALFDRTSQKLTGTEVLTPVIESNFSKATIRAASTWNVKLNAQNKIENGIIYSAMSFNMKDKLYNYDADFLEQTLFDEGHTSMTQAFTSWKYRPNERLTLVSGVHFLHFRLNNSYNVEPRFGMKWKTSTKGTVSAGFGMHSKVESVSVYLAQQSTESGGTARLNKSLEPTKSMHFVLGYGQTVNANTHLKAEVYYQHLYDVPTGVGENDHYSLLNEYFEYAPGQLVNQGTGTNYGVELTAERFFHKGFYYLGTVSLYESLYTPLDGLERTSAFDGGYVVNFLTGKEWSYGKSRHNKVFFTNAKVALIGGVPYTPIDLEASRTAGYEVQATDLFSANGDDVFVLNVSFGFRKDKEKTTQEFKIDLQNATNNQAVVREYYMPNTERILESKQLGLFPTISYTLKF